MQAQIGKARRRKRQVKRNQAARPESFQNYHGAIMAVAQELPNDRHVGRFASKDHIDVLVTEMRENDDTPTRRGVMAAVQRLLERNAERRRTKKAKKTRR